MPVNYHSKFQFQISLSDLKESTVKVHRLLEGEILQSLPNIHDSMFKINHIAIFSQQYTAQEKIHYVSNHIMLIKILKYIWKKMRSHSIDILILAGS